MQFYEAFFVFNRLNDMWTISLQDREQACWEEVTVYISLIHKQDCLIITPIFTCMNDSEDIIVCLTLISIIELWAVTEGNANMTRMFVAKSVGVTVSIQTATEKDRLYKVI